MVENPPYSSDLELFTRELNWDTRPTISKFYSPVICGVMGFGLATAVNFFGRKPLLSGIQKHIVLTALGVPAGLYVDQKLDRRYAERDAVLIHYMRTHPEDFPVQERIKYKDVLEPWLPKR